MARDEIITTRTHGSCYHPPSNCPYCGLRGHSKNSCFELIDYPVNWDKTHDPRCNKPRVLIAETKVHSEHTVNDGKVLKVSASVTNNTWITDSGATEHMTCDSRQVQTLKPSTKIVVSVANGNHASIIREGDVSL